MKAWMLRTVFGARPGESCLGTMPERYLRTAARAACIEVSQASDTWRGDGSSSSALPFNQYAYIAESVFRLTRPSASNFAYSVSRAGSSSRWRRSAPMCGMTYDRA